MFKVIAMVRTLLKREFPNVVNKTITSRTFINGKSLPYFPQYMHKTFAIDESLIGDILEPFWKKSSHYGV